MHVLAKKKNFIFLSQLFANFSYMEAAIPQFDAHHFRRFVVLSKDTLSLKCDDCLSADLFWLVYVMC
jgi:hypothetical protein